MNKEKLAHLTSTLLSPLAWFPILIVVFLLKTGISSKQIIILFPSLFIFLLFIPLGILYLAIRAKKISDWDIRDRRERNKILPFIMISILVAMVLVYIFGNSLSFHLFLIPWAVALAGIVITKFWKISLHTMLNVTSTILVNFIFNWQLPFLYFLILLIGWARYYHKHHSLLQIIIGAIVSGLITIGMLTYFGYL